MSHFFGSDESAWSETPFLQFICMFNGNHHIFLPVDNEGRAGDLVYLAQIVKLLGEQTTQESYFGLRDAFD